MAAHLQQWTQLFRIWVFELPSDMLLSAALFFIITSAFENKSTNFNSNLLYSRIHWSTSIDIEGEHEQKGNATAIHKKIVERLYGSRNIHKRIILSIRQCQNTLFDPIKFPILI